jgi:hypothetical protein
VTLSKAPTNNNRRNITRNANKPSFFKILSAYLKVLLEIEETVLIATTNLQLTLSLYFQSALFNSYTKFFFQHAFIILCPDGLVASILSFIRPIVTVSSNTDTNTNM